MPTDPTLEEVREIISREVNVWTTHDRDPMYASLIAIQKAAAPRPLEYFEVIDAAIESCGNPRLGPSSHIIIHYESGSTVRTKTSRIREAILGDLRDEDYRITVIEH